MTTSPSGTVLKAFAVLQLFHQYPSLGVTQCADILNLSRPTAHRMLHTLTVAGAVERTPSGGYRLALGMFEIGTKTAYFKRFSEVAQEPLGRLAAETNLRGHLAVRSDDNLLYLLGSPGGRPDNQQVGTIGNRNPLHATALGKLLLAYAPSAVIESVLQQDLTRFTPYTVVRPATLRDQLSEIKRTGVAHVCGERFVGVAAAAVAVRDQNQRVVAGVGVTAPAERYRRHLASLHSPLRRAAQAIESNLAVRPGVANELTA